MQNPLQTWRLRLKTLQSAQSAWRVRSAAALVAAVLAVPACAQNTAVDADSSRAQSAPQQEQMTQMAQTNQMVPMPQMDLPRTQLRAGRARMQVQIASAAHQLQTGLMHRREMPADEGMLFVFPQAGVQCFWMKNTLLPLTAAFIAADGTIVNLADMQPLSEQNHCSAQPVPYVLEMRQGWFKRQGIRPGMKVRDVQGRLFKAVR